MSFPDRTLINDMLAFNRAYRQHLDNRQAMELSNAWELHEMLLEADRLYQIWDLVRDTRCDYYYVTVRRQALKKLKELIGDQAYYSGSCRRTCRSGSSPGSISDGQGRLAQLAPCGRPAGRPPRDQGGDVAAP